MKVCTGCKETKDLECFSLHSGFKDGRNSRCKICKCTAQKAGYKRGDYTKVPYSYKSDIKYKYGMSMETYENMLIACDNKCQICGSDGKLNIDHCHSTGVVRGLLCTRCNTGLGKLGDSREGLLAALRYLDGESTGS